MLYNAGGADRLAILWADAQQHLVLRDHRDKFLFSRAFGLADSVFYLILTYIVHQGFKLSIAFPAFKAYYSRGREHYVAIKACPENYKEPSKGLFARSKAL